MKPTMIRHEHPWRDDNLCVAGLWYPAPHNTLRVEIQSDDVAGDMTNMTMQQAMALGRALMSVATGVADGNAS